MGHGHGFHRDNWQSWEHLAADGKPGFYQPLYLRTVVKALDTPGHEVLAVVEPGREHTLLIF